jgi:PiT family inorganic phosphate transporter
MPDTTSFGLLLVVIGVSIAFGMVNGFTDAANAIATVIGSRVLSPRVAISMAAILNLVGALSGTAVAKTIGDGILRPESLRLTTVVAGAIATVIWSTIAWRWGLPTSESHGLIAGLIGAGLATAGASAIVWSVLGRVFLMVILAPVLGFSGGFLVMVALLWIFRHSTPASVGGIFRYLQILSAAFMAFSHGRGDAQLPMGVIGMALIIYYQGSAFHLPLWVILLSAAAVSLGTALGGRRIIRTMGTKITHLQPVHGFAAEGAAASVITISSTLGIPASTTHVINSSIMGVGATKRLSAVRWGVAREVVTAWILTFPICGAIGLVLGFTCRLIF